MAEVIAVVRSIRERVADPKADFTWSSWVDQGAALRELDRRLAELDRNEVDHSGLSILFTPTGPVQEVATHSGWGNAFVELADRYDAAMAKIV